MKKHVTERVLILILSIAVLLSSTGAYSAFATEGATSSVSVTQGESTTAAQSNTTDQNSTEQNPANPTKPNVVNEGGSVKTDALSGSGTTADPYVITNADDLVKMQAIINNSAKTDKNFVLGADINLASVSLDDLKANKITQGALVSVSKGLADSTPKSVWFSLDGKGHKIYGLDVKNNALYGIAIFGYISHNSTIKNIKFEDCAVNVTSKMSVTNAVVALYNDGTIENCSFNNISLSVFESATCNYETKGLAGGLRIKASTGIVSGFNAGTIKNITASALTVKVDSQRTNIGAIVGENNGEIVEASISSVSIETSKENVSSSIGLIAGYNSSKILKAAADKSTIKQGTYVGGIAGSNAGVITDCLINGKAQNTGSATAENATFIGNGIIGAISGSNTGKIGFCSTTDVGALVGNEAVYGGIVGVNTALVSDSVSSGAVSGGSVSGGVIGKTLQDKDGKETASIAHCYTFVKLPAAADNGAIIGVGGAALASQNTWSKDISGRFMAYENGDSSADMAQNSKLIVIKNGETKTISKVAMSGEWGEVSQTVDTTKSFTLSGSGVAFKDGSSNFVLTAKDQDKISSISYTARIVVRAGYKNSTIFNQKMNVTVLTVPKTTIGDGLTEKTALEVSNLAQFEMIKAAPYAHFVLSNDIDVPKTFESFAFSGALDGAGYTIKTKTSIFAGVYGSIKNLNVELCDEITTAILGEASGANFDNVRLVCGEAEENSTTQIRLAASRPETGAFLNKVTGNTVINNCSSQIPVHITNKEISDVASFIGVVDAKAAVISSSGASAAITSDFKDKIKNAAAFIGNVKSNQNGSVTECFGTLISDVAEYALIGGGDKTVSVKNSYYSSSNAAIAAAPASFENVQAIKWGFDSGEQGFISGKGSVVSIALPQITAFEGAAASDFTADYDEKTLNLNLEAIVIKNGVIYLPVEAAKGAVSVINSEITLIHKATGLRASVRLSNGLEKDKDGNYLISYAVDLAFVSENLDEFNGESFKMTRDIDMAQLEDFEPIGSAAKAFSGEFDGCGYKISGLSIDATSNTALFATIENAKIKNIVFDLAKVSASGSYAAILAGQVVGNSQISKITINNSSVKAQGDFAGALAGYVGSGCVISEITIENTTISALNKAGGMAGALGEGNSLSNIKANKANVQGFYYVGGVVGSCEKGTALSEVTSKNSNVIGSGYVGSIAGYAQATINNSNVDSNNISATHIAGGIAGALSGEIKNSKVYNTSITAGTVGGLIGCTIKEEETKILNSEINKSTVTAQGSNSIAGGFAALSASGSKTEITNSVVGSQSIISAGVVTGGFIGEAQDVALISNSSTYAAINGFAGSSKSLAGTGGAVGRVSADDLAKLSITKANIGGEITAYESVGGIIGTTLCKKASAVSINNCVVASSISFTSKTGAQTSAYIIGNTNDLTSADITTAVKAVVFSSYNSELKAFSSIDAPLAYCDLDKAVSSSLTAKLDSDKEFTISVSNSKAKELGFEFDNEKGWLSESNDLIEVVKSSENLATLKAHKSAEIAIVGTYRLIADKNIRLNVHFDANSNIKVALAGSGTQKDPYKISTTSDLAAVADYAGEGAHFTLTNDITFSAADFAFGGEFYNNGVGFMPIGDLTTAFNGVFNGAGHKISGIKIQGTESAALFGNTNGATISNLVVDNLSIKSTDLSAALAARAKNTVISNITVSNSAITAALAEGSAGAVAGFASGCEISNIKITSSSISAGENASTYSVASVGGVCARAVETKISSTEVSKTVELKTSGAAGGIVGYGDELTITNSKTFASVNGESASAIAANVKGTLVAENITAGGIINAQSYAGAIAAKANAAIKAKNICVCSQINAEKAGVAVGYANEDVFTDSASNEVFFENIIYSSYQNAINMFALEKINAYQSADYISALCDINAVSSSTGDFVAVGKNELKLSQALKFNIGVTGDIMNFNISKTDFELESVYSEPEGLISYNAANSTITAVKTEIENAKLVLKYSNGITIATDMISVVGMAGSGTQSDPYLINSEDTMKLLGVYPSASFTLTDNVELTEEWTAVKAFTGKLDGSMYSITGLTVNNKADAGLFESVNNATIENLTFVNTKISGQNNAGVVAGSLAGSTKIKNVSVVSSSVNALAYAGAIVGSADALGAEISSCVVTASTVSATEAAGIAAAASGDLKIKDSSVSACTIKGLLSAGGITATANAEKFVISGCETASEIEAKNAGAILGVAQSGLEISSCTTTSKVKGTYSEGGVIAFVETELDANLFVKDCVISSQLSKQAKHSAAIVARFKPLVKDNEDFALMFSGNTVTTGDDEFEPAVMSYQNFTSSQIKDEEEISLSGKGTAQEPYEIKTASDFAEIPDGTQYQFILKNDIKLTAADYGISVNENGETVYGAFYGGYKPIKDFSGVLNGNGHVISGLYINNELDYTGLFANIKATGVVKNLHLEILEQEDGYGFFGITGKDYVGAIAGYCEADSGIENCSATGGVITGGRMVGGVVGALAASSVSNSFALTTIKAQESAGGLVGAASGVSSIKNSFASCEVISLGGSLVGANTGSLVVEDVFVSGSSLGLGSASIGENKGEITALRMIIAGSNNAGAAQAILANKTELVYSDKTTLLINDEKTIATSTKELTASKPDGLDSWSFIKGSYAVPLMADEYSNKWAQFAAKPAVAGEAYIGNVEFEYTLSNKTGDSSFDETVVGVLIKSSEKSGSVITSDFFTTCKASPKELNKILVKSGGFYINASLPTGYVFEITAKDSNGKNFKVSDFGSQGKYIEIGTAEFVSVNISIVKADVPWGLTSLWESISR